MFVEFVLWYQYVFMLTDNPVCLVLSQPSTVVRRFLYSQTICVLPFGIILCPPNETSLLFQCLKVSSDMMLRCAPVSILNFIILLCLLVTAYLEVIFFIVKLFLYCALVWATVSDRLFRNGCLPHLWHCALAAGHL